MNMIWNLGIFIKPFSLTHSEVSCLRSLSIDCKRSFGCSCSCNSAWCDNWWDWSSGSWCNYWSWYEFFILQYILVLVLFIFPLFFSLFELFTQTLLLSTKDMTGWSDLTMMYPLRGNDTCLYPSSNWNGDAVSILLIDVGHWFL